MKKSALILWLWGAGLLFSATDAVRLNQVGFYPQMPKIAVVVNNVGATTFMVAKADLSDTLYTGSLTPAKFWDLSGEAVSLADFSSVTQTGTFVLIVPGIGVSYPFEIKPYVHQRVAMWSLKSYYFQRASMELTEQYAGKWKRKLGHPDNKVYVHESAATAARPKDTILSCPRGWYDAGDYNKYIVNSGISTFTLLQLYENFPDYCKSLDTNIPESGNAIPDVLDEAVWNIRWMLTMQDPNDGGVYHKLTNENFDAFVMPHQATSKRWVVMKSTAAALDFAAVMAVSARVFREFESVMPGFADSCLTAALAAWNWARQNPAVYYRQSEMNKIYKPAINTGEYGDGNVSDEFQWAAMELFCTTHADSFLSAVKPFQDASTSLP
ncbi:MAG: glycoside hydrolase family 9 protein, partial [candidate division KSB1 bacterium]|nr:glycoside hydrolase family 9 protein [candidate division KSB1 bacterium]